MCFIVLILEFQLSMEGLYHQFGAAAGWVVAGSVGPGGGRVGGGRWRRRRGGLACVLGRFGLFGFVGCGGRPVGRHGLWRRSVFAGLHFLWSLNNKN